MGARSEQRIASSFFPGQFAILFRNNHFNVIYKHENQICQLVTDVGYANKSVVWEILNEVYSN